MNEKFKQMIFSRFGEWYEEAKAAEPHLPNAMTLATADADGRPSARMVLLKGWGEDGFVYYTNLDSRKSHEIAANPRGALVLYWKATAKQIRIEGRVEQVSDEEADAYFATRPRAARIGAWASRQSHEIASKGEFEMEVAKFSAKFAVGEVPRPEFWSGFRLVPDAVEFWEERKFRLHRRELFRLEPDGEWSRSLLYP